MEISNHRMCSWADFQSKRLFNRRIYRPCFLYNHAARGCLGIGTARGVKGCLRQQRREGHGFEKGSGTVAETAHRVLRTTVPDPFLNPLFEPCPTEAEVTVCKVRILLDLSFMAGLLFLVGCGGGDVPNEAPPVEAAPAVLSANVVQGDISFVKGYSQGHDRARWAGKPMLLFFTAEWCSYCHQMADEAFVDSQVVGLAESFVCVLIDADAEPEVCRQYGVRGYPTIQFTSTGGVPLNRLVGKQPAGHLALQMRAALQAIASRTDQPPLL